LFPPKQGSRIKQVNKGRNENRREKQKGEKITWTRLLERWGEAWEKKSVELTVCGQSRKTLRPPKNEIRTGEDGWGNSANGVEGN